MTFICLHSIIMVILAVKSHANVYLHICNHGTYACASIYRNFYMCHPIVQLHTVKGSDVHFESQVHLHYGHILS